jgi:type VI secretion system secreted protein VgrG
MAYTQENRLIAIDTPLGRDALLLQGFTGQEGLSQLFRFELDLLSERGRIAFEQIIGKRVTLTVVLADGGTRYLNGFISRFTQTGSDERFTHYQAEMVPWLWFLTRTADCRIFQKQTVPEIVSKIFSDLGFSDYRLALQGSFEAREYCVQYRETDYNFVARLLEQYGIYYFFEHAADKHTLVLGNTATVHAPCAGQGRVRYEYVGGTREEEDVITDWQVEQELRAGKYALRDYNFEMPSTSLGVSVESTVNPGSDGKYEVYDYPGEYEKKGAGQELVKVRMEEEEVGHEVVSGASTCRAFGAGYRFELEEYAVASQNRAYVLTEVQHVATVGENYLTGGEAGEEEHYSNHFTCIPHTVPYRPPRLTAKPVINGAHTAVVVGKAGEEIWTDKYGRVKVQFHWDREGKYNENSSCWIRVAQNWAGKRWGAMFLPRIGQEVIVKFLDGDADQPIITGRVYNAEQMPPYGLPGEQTKSAIKTYSSKGGGGFNEIRFEDKKGQEQVFMHAERNQDVRVKKDALEWVGQDRHLIVVRDQLEAVKGDKHLQVTGDHNEKIDGTMSLKVGMDLQEKVGMKHALDAGMEIHLKAGMNVVIEAGMTVTLKAGGGFIVVGPAGVAISGMPILINSGGAAQAGSGASPEAPKAPQEADKAQPGEAAALPTQTPLQAPSPQATALRLAARLGAPFCEKCAEAARAAALTAGATPEEAEEAALAAGRAGGAEAGAETDEDVYRRATGPLEPGAGPPPESVARTSLAAESPGMEPEAEEDEAVEPAPETSKTPETPPVDVVIRLDVDPSDASSLDDRFVLESTDGSYHSEKMVKDDNLPGDAFTDLRFTGLSRERSYTLKAFTSADAEPTIIFESVPYDQLAGLSSRRSEQQG